MSSIGSAVSAAVRDIETEGGASYITSAGERYTRHAVPHYTVEARGAGKAWSLVLTHYGTPILYASQDADGTRDSAIGPGWWGSRTDMSAIAKAHRALGMRRSIRGGRLVTW